MCYLQPLSRLLVYGWLLLYLTKLFFTALCYEGVICELYIKKAVESTIGALF